MSRFNAGFIDLSAGTVSFISNILRTSEWMALMDIQHMFDE
jgi:hypothetical protein